MNHSDWRDVLSLVLIQSVTSPPLRRLHASPSHPNSSAPPSSSVLQEDVFILSGLRVLVGAAGRAAGGASLFSPVELRSARFWVAGSPVATNQGGSGGDKSARRRGHSPRPRPLGCVPQVSREESGFLPPAPAPLIKQEASSRLISTRVTLA